MTKGMPVVRGRPLNLACGDHPALPNQRAWNRCHFLAHLNDTRRRSLPPATLAVPEVRRPFRRFRRKVLPYLCRPWLQQPSRRGADSEETFIPPHFHPIHGVSLTTHVECCISLVALGILQRTYPNREGGCMAAMQRGERRRKMTIKFRSGYYLRPRNARDTAANPPASHAVRASCPMLGPGFERAPVVR